MNETAKINIANDKKDLSELQKMAARISQLEKENSELMADKERINWLEQKQIREDRESFEEAAKNHPFAVRKPIFPVSVTADDGSIIFAKTFRDAVDQARKSVA